MEVLHLPCALPHERTIVALGYFDGVHLGHRALLEKTAEQARLTRAKSAVFTFPSLSVKKGAPLCTLEERLDLFADCGIERVYLSEFEPLHDLSPNAFVRHVLVEQCSAMWAICGFNYRFGKGAAGDASRLKELLPGSISIDPSLYENAPISTTRIRDALSKGDVSTAASMLGRPYTVCSTVLHGKSLGHTLGLPTANMKPEKALPCAGVYKTRVTVDGKEYIALSDVGTRPTVEGAGETRLETFIPHFSGDLYGKRLSVSFLSRIRDEMKFESLDALTAQIQRDIDTALKESCK